MYEASLSEATSVGFGSAFDHGRADWISALAASFAEAGSASADISSDRYEIADGAMVIRCASSPLRRRLTRAFAHLALAPDAPLPPDALSIHLWDSASTRTPPPPLPTVPAGHAHGALFFLEQPPLRALYQPGLGSLSVLEMDTGTAWHWVRDAEAIPYWDEASPLRQILFWWLWTRGYLQVHGGAVGTEHGGVLFVGKSGSGKSTASLSVLGSSRLLFAGDDYVSVSVGSPLRVASLYGSAKLEPAHVRATLSHLVPLLDNGDRLATEKAVVYVNSHFPDQLTGGFPLHALILPRVDPVQTGARCVEVSRGEAFAALAPSTIVQLHTAGQGALAALSRLAHQLPCYRLEFGRDIRAIPRAIGELLDA